MEPAPKKVHRVLGHLSVMRRLMAKLLYGSGLRLMECLRLRVKDLDFTHLEIDYVKSPNLFTPSKCSRSQAR
jgi:integrase